MQPSAREVEGSIRRCLVVADESSRFRHVIEYHLRETWADAAIERCSMASFQDLTVVLDGYHLVLIEDQVDSRGRSAMTWLRGLGRHEGAARIVLISDDTVALRLVESRKGDGCKALRKEDLSTQALRRVVGAPPDGSSGSGDEQSASLGNTTVLRGVKTGASSTGCLQGRDEVPPREGTGSAGGRASQALIHAEILVPGYQILAELGKGAMATAYLAERMEDQMMVALKVLYIQDVRDPAILRRFMREYSLIAKVESPHVVQIYERAAASDYAYIAMEYCPGGDLAARIAAGIAVENALEYARQLAMGLGAAHKRGVIHRDVKPCNVLFRDDDTLALTDFGIATRIETAGGMTSRDTLLGTPYYLSPERINGLRADTRSDIYSLGVMMFEMLTGHRPFTAKTLSSLLNAHVEQPVPRLPQALSCLQPLIDGLLSKDPDERFQSTDELLMALDWQ